MKKTKNNCVVLQCELKQAEDNAENHDGEDDLVLMADALTTFSNGRSVVDILMRKNKIIIRLKN